MNKSIRKLMWVLFLLYLIMLLLILFGDNIFVRDANRHPLVNHINLEPFFEIRRYIDAFSNHSIHLQYVIANLWGNIVLFMPFTVFLAVMFKPFSRWYVTLPFMALVICSVEILQYMTRRGSCDIDDFILNFLGSVVAFAAVFFLKKVLTKRATL